MRHAVFYACLAACAALRPAWADTASDAAPGPVGEYLADWESRVAAARDSQPAWSSPLVTTTAMLEERVRVDFSFQHAGNGADTTDIDGGKGVDLIVADATEIQLAAAPYYIRTTTGNKANLSGFNDWPFFRLKERLFSGNAENGDYIVSAWVQTQAAAGIGALTNHVLTVLPTLGFGKGFGDFVVQGSFGGVIPTDREATIGAQVTGNLALQYHVAGLFWPQLEANWTHYVGGSRDGRDQVFLTPGIVAGRFALNDRLKASFGVGYQVAVEPHYQPSPLLPSYNHAWLLTTRLNF